MEKNFYHKNRFVFKKGKVNLNLVFPETATLNAVSTKNGYFVYAYVYVYLDMCTYLDRHPQDRHLFA